MVVTNAHPLAEMKTTASIRKTLGNSGKLMGELLTRLVRDQGPTWVAEKWDQSGLQWSDVVNTQLENVDNIIKQYVSAYAVVVVPIYQNNYIDTCIETYILITNCLT